MSDSGQATSKFEYTDEQLQYVGTLSPSGGFGTYTESEWLNLDRIKASTYKFKGEIRRYKVQPSNKAIADQLNVLQVGDPCIKQKCFNNDGLIKCTRLYKKTEEGLFCKVIPWKSKSVFDPESGLGSSPSGNNTLTNTVSCGDSMDDSTLSGPLLKSFQLMDDPNFTFGCSQVGDTAGTLDYNLQMSNVSSEPLTPLPAPAVLFVSPSHNVKKLHPDGDIDEISNTVTVKQGTVLENVVVKVDSKPTEDKNTESSKVYDMNPTVHLKDLSKQEKEGQCEQRPKDKIENKGDTVPEKLEEGEILSDEDNVRKASTSHQDDVESEKIHTTVKDGSPVSGNKDPRKLVKIYTPTVDSIDESHVSHLSKLLDDKDVISLSNIVQSLDSLQKEADFVAPDENLLYSCVLNQLEIMDFCPDVDNAHQLRLDVCRHILIDYKLYRVIGRSYLEFLGQTLYDYVENLETDSRIITPLEVVALARYVDVDFTLLSANGRWHRDCSEDRHIETKGMHIVLVWNGVDGIINTKPKRSKLSMKSRKGVVNNATLSKNSDGADISTIIEISSDYVPDVEKNHEDVPDKECDEEKKQIFIEKRSPIPLLNEGKPRSELSRSLMKDFTCSLDSESEFKLTQSNVSNTTETSTNQANSQTSTKPMQISMTKGNGSRKDFDGGKAPGRVTRSSSTKDDTLQGTKKVVGKRSLTSQQTQLSQVMTKSSPTKEGVKKVDVVQQSATLPRMKTRQSTLLEEMAKKKSTSAPAVTTTKQQTLSYTPLRTGLKRKADNLAQSSGIPASMDSPQREDIGITQLNVIPYGGQEEPVMKKCPKKICLDSEKEQLSETDFTNFPLHIFSMQDKAYFLEEALRQISNLKNKVGTLQEELNNTRDLLESANAKISKFENFDVPASEMVSQSVTMGESIIKQDTMKYDEELMDEYDDLDESASQTSKRKISCDICDKTYKYASALDRHKKTHHTDILKCHICAKTFSRKDALNLHINDHLGRFKFNCEYCGQGFNNKTHYTGHINKHENNKPHKCANCNLAYFRKQELTQHMKVCTSDEVYPCDLCPKIFNSEKCLKQHALRHRNMTVFTCDICGKSFKSLEGVKMHYELSHSNN